MKAVFVLFALFAVAAAEPGLLASPAIAVAQPALVHTAPVAYHAAPAIAVPSAVSSSYKIRAPAAKVLATPVIAAHPAPVLLH